MKSQGLARNQRGGSVSQPREPCPRAQGPASQIAALVMSPERGQGLTPAGWRGTPNFKVKIK